MQPRPTLKAFGPEYRYLCIAAFDSCVKGESRDLVLSFANHAAALAMKLRLYSFFNALRDDGKQVDLIALVDQLSLQCPKNGHIVRFYLAINAWDAQHIRGHFGLPDNYFELSNEEPQVQATLQKLKALRENTV